MRSTKIAAYLVTCLLLQACAEQSPPPAAQRAPPAQTAQEVVLATERVTLSDGKTYEVQTGNGLPLPFKNDQIEITGMSPLFSQAGQHKWAFQAQLHEPGDFLVTVTTPIDSSTFTMFDCAGPGRSSRRSSRASAIPRSGSGSESRARAGSRSCSASEKRILVRSSK